MLVRKKLDLGEYIVKVLYEDETGELKVEVFDELNEIIESIHITNDEDSDDDEELNSPDEFSLN